MNLRRINTWLFCIVIALTLTGMLAPAMRKIKQAAERTQTVERMKQMGLANQAYHDAFKQLPPAFDRSSTTDIPVSVHIHFLPYLDQQALFQTCAANEQGSADAVVHSFITPEDGSVERFDGVQNFAANLRVFSLKGRRTASAKDMPPLSRIEPGGSLTMLGITRGSSNTIVFATKLGECSEGGSRYAADPTSPFGAYFGQNAARTTAHYSNPQSIYQWAPRGDECRCSPLMAQTYHAQPIVACWADGTVRLVPGHTPPGHWNGYLHPTATE